MDSDQAAQMLALQQSMYSASLDANLTAHTALAYTQYLSTVAEVGVLVALVAGIIICAMLRREEAL